MRRIVIMTLVLAICIGLCACGKKETSVELTLENWNEYLEIKRVNQWKEDSFGDVTSVESAVWLCVKEEYAQKVNVDKLELAVEITYGLDNLIYSVDFADKTLEIMGPANDEPAFESREESVTYSQEDIFFNKEYYAGEEYRSILPLICLFQPDWITEEQIATDLDGKSFQTFEQDPTVTRIQGTIWVKES